ncbi:hypothetical protein [Mycobacterium leprae]|uniref:hypothetical protein n=1 Tax=Mycobacterium leprae TaxID=1769 RepID=UPI00059CDC75|nr:hypothetical protein [Mycobacterium leprae]
MAPLQDLVYQVLVWLGGTVGDLSGNSVLTGLLGYGIIGGVGIVLQFIPRIALHIFVDCSAGNVGYMARAAFLMERVMVKTGLEGCAFVVCCTRSPVRSRALWLPERCHRKATESPPYLSASLMTYHARLTGIHFADRCFVRAI